MIQFTKLRLSGFKSFVDKTELEIGPGLNGIVGPNGCGKSNLVEALRWVMGESSAKRMRGSGMEDVIFAGTDRRSPRNLAEVSLLLNNDTRQAPAAYNSADEIEVIRKIERDKGSGYKINGKNARARDVQMLFADTVTGSNSPSLVSQGHVTRMINAKPHDRRLILEESAGIAGLYARRHEAELRLKAADTNLIRVEDVLGSMESRLNSLKRQSRQASKYKNLSAQIRQLELVITYLEWHALLEKQKDAKDKFAQCESIVAEKLITVTQLTKTQNTQVEDLPPLRKKESESAAILQKHKLEFQRLVDEIERHKTDLQDTKNQLHQMQIDQQREEQTLEETSGLLACIEEEHSALIQEQENEGNTELEKQKTRDTLKIKVTELEERFTTLKENAAESRAREDALIKQKTRNQERMDILQTRKTTALEQKQALIIDENSQKTIKELENKTAQYEESLQKLNGKTENARLAINKAEERTEEKRAILSTIEKEYAGFSSEIKMLEKFFENDNEESYGNVLDSIVTKPGFEKALSRALGDSLMASTDTNAPTNWRTNSKFMAFPDLPDGAQALLPYIDAPKELHVSLSQIGYVENDEQGEAIYPALKQGQSLVSANGTYWRWDGYHVKSEATDRHSVYLEQKNKLIELQSRQSKIEGSQEEAQDALNAALEIQADTKEHYNVILNNIKEIEIKLKELRPALQKIKEKNLRIESEQKRFTDQINAYNEDIRTLEETISQDKIAYEAIQSTQDEGEHSDSVIETIKFERDSTKEEYQNAVRTFDILIQEKSTRNARIQAIADERISLKNRSIRAREHLKTLRTRIESLSEKLNELSQKPLNVDKGQEDALNKIEELETFRNIAAERLATCEEEVATTSKALKEAENLLGSSREDRASAQAILASLNEQLITMETSIEETLEIKPKDLINHTAVDLVKYQTSDLPKLKGEKDSLTRERDSIGPVNLRAEEESSDLEKELTTLLNERNDLMQAIDELRGAINKINKEARERLLIAFDHVNAHFQRLFINLFGGGKAYLKLIDSDDPLGAGLEIYAQPPGKALQSLSLLSGGEQTLASIALIFGMFLTNPSPICVLDEIDAPLDDANVDRVCNLLDEIAARGETRFLVITHHRLSMARMDRLYGVTMSERGVSQLVSVDLQQSFEFIDQKVA
ncbi:MAG: chromosome segregation protein SMC [Alphaproteobacteria bacterium]